MILAVGSLGTVSYSQHCCKCSSLAQYNGISQWCVLALLLSWRVLCCCMKRLLLDCSKQYSTQSWRITKTQTEKTDKRNCWGYSGTLGGCRGPQMEAVPYSFLKPHSWVSAGRQRWSCDLWADVCEDHGLQDREGCLCGWDKPPPHRLGLFSTQLLWAQCDTHSTWNGRLSWRTRREEGEWGCALGTLWGSGCAEIPQPSSAPLSCPSARESWCPSIPGPGTAISSSFKRTVNI